MSFQLSLQIEDDGSTSVDFDGQINHMVLVGVLENIKHSILRTIEFQSMEQALENSEESSDEESLEDSG